MLDYACLGCLPIEMNLFLVELIRWLLLIDGALLFVGFVLRVVFFVYLLCCVLFGCSDVWFLGLVLYMSFRFAFGMFNY